ncbi:arsenite transporter, ACR3 family [Azotobacter beijerinckii]|uniref:Arsenite transporter, ACR3 family n=2 Tax=Azotobacter beijerinckii TaxID=170623 RepID=A0A1H9FH96_9GAMM|nr:arsenite transporter, ACR3 family [Azotobacter beijerinckii]SEQ37269.1 arsenite transporter, ACR3 family [Azotobacter beijerinckii]
MDFQGVDDLKLRAIGAKAPPTARTHLDVNIFEKTDERLMTIDVNRPEKEISPMSSPCEVAARQAAGAPLGFFERYLTLWVFLCIVAGTLLGLYAPAVAQGVGALEIAQVNLPVGVLIWVMIVPMLMKIDFGALHELYQQKAGMGITLFVNWAVKPFSMALLGWLFIEQVFAPWLPAGEIDSYMAGLILLGAAPCTAMVFVWSNLCGGNANFTLTQVALNDLVMIFAFAPIVALLLGVSSIPVPWDTLLLSVAMYIVVPLAIAQFIRARLLRRGAAAFQTALAKIGPFSIVALLATLVLLFSFQGEAIVEQPLIILMLAVPILLQTLFIAGLGYWLNRRFRVRHDIAGPSTMIGASNFFELAVAVAIVLYGFDSGAALATVVGVLIEVPVMLWLVRTVNRSRAWYERGLSHN